jgi:hypothetical protein
MPYKKNSSSELKKFSYFNSWTLWNSRITNAINKLNVSKEKLVYYILEKKKI